jgi:DNA-binding NarL/FixJ family response regulator
MITEYSSSMTIRSIALALKGAIAAACTDTRSSRPTASPACSTRSNVIRTPILLLLDLNLPGAYGFSALAHLRGSHPELPVIVVSATDDRRTVRQALGVRRAGLRVQIRRRRDHRRRASRRHCAANS